MSPHSLLDAIFPVFFGHLQEMCGEYITCSFITLALDIHVFCLHAEAQGAILHTKKRFEECTENLAFRVGGANASLWLRLCILEVRITTGLNGFDPRNDLVLGGIRIWHGLHESSYCYFKVYAGTRTLITSAVWCTSWITHTNVSVYYPWCTSSVRVLPKPV